jgi:hypothetical protein
MAARRAARNALRRARSRPRPPAAAEVATTVLAFLRSTIPLGHSAGSAAHQRLRGQERPASWPAHRLAGAQPGADGSFARYGKSFARYGKADSISSVLRWVLPVSRRLTFLSAAHRRPTVGEAPAQRRCAGPRAGRPPAALRVVWRRSSAQRGSTGGHSARTQAAAPARQARHRSSASS